MKNPKFELFQSDKNSKYYFRLNAANGQIILASQAYESKQSCSIGIASVKINAPIDSRYEKKDNLPNHTFNLKAANGEIIGRSESYTSSAARDNGIESVKNNAPIAPTEDLTNI